MHPRKLGRLALLVGGGLIAAALVAGGAVGSGVDPASFDATVAVGGNVTITKTVHTPVIPPVPDIYFLSDTTGSMGPAIANVQANAGSIMSGVSASQPGAQFGAGDYKDFEDPSNDQDPYVFRNDAPVGPSVTAIGGINTWSADGGSDGPEGTLYALHRIATDPASIGWRSGSTRVLVWFGDAPAHDPVCDGFTHLGFNLTTSLVASELAAAHIKVIAISLNTGGYLTGLNDNTSIAEYEYDGVCGPPTPITGQAAAITAATGGLDLFAATPNDVTGKILLGLQNLSVAVTPVPVCDPGLTASYDAASKTVTSGTDATFSETFSVAGDAQAGTTLHCNVDFLLNGVHQDGFQQSSTITVPAVTGTVIVRERTDPAGDTTPFTFTGDAAGHVAGDGGTFSTTLAPGTYTSTETALDGWDLTGLTCDDSNSTGDLASRTATFRLAAGETVTCTFTNTKRAQLVVQKVTTPSPDPSNTPFTYTGHPAGTVAGGGTLTESVAPGTYTSTETAVPGWSLTGLSCDDSNSTGDVGSATATFRAAPGETVTCTFTNRASGTIVVRKRTLPAGDTTPFAFTGDAAGTVSGDGGTLTVNNLAPGTYTSTEAAPAGWDLTGLSCDDSDSTGSLSSRTATFHLAAGETITCTFTNTKRGSIVVKSRTLPAGSTASFAFTGDAAGTISTDGGTLTVNNLPPATYSTTETAPAGWDVSALACDDSDSTGDVASRTATFQLAPGETVTCTFTSAKRAQLVVRKVTAPSPDPSGTGFTFTGHPNGTLANGGTLTESIAPGTYTSTELAAPGWDLTALSCDDGDSTGDLPSRTATFRASPGETVTCTFTDARRGTIVVKSKTVPAGSTAGFAFTGDAAGSIATDGGTLTVNNLAPGTYTSTETAPAGWDLTALSCDDTDSTGNLTTGKATFQLAAGETVTCTFTNTKRGTIVVKSKTVPAGSTAGFAFTGDAAGSIATDGGTLTVNNLAPGTYTSTETAPAGWDLTALSCDDTDSSGNLTTGKATFQLAAGETVTCTFTNTKRGTIVVKSKTVPTGSTAGFAFTGDAAGSIATDGGTLTVNNLTPGTYTSTETAPAGWDLTALSCDDTDSSGNLTTGKATFQLAAGETVTCTFTNTKRGTIVVKSKTVPTGSTAGFAFTGDAAGSIATDGGTLTVNNLAPGTYTSTETAPAGWDLTALSCDDTDSTGNLATGKATFQLAAGETVTCTFTNTKRGTIVVKNRRLPASDTTAFAYTGDAAGTIAADGGTLTTTLTPGTYSSTQTALAGWDLGSLSCDDTDSTVNLATRTATFHVAAGETVTCTFTNTKRGTIVVKNRRLPASDTTAFAYTGDAAGTIAADGGTLTASLAPGTYSSTETVPSGWDLTGLTCDDTDSTGNLATGKATFQLAAGETVTCTFTNTKRGTIVVKSKTLPTGDTTAFGFTGGVAGTIATDGGTITVGNLAPATYSSTENAVTGWDLSALACDDSDSTGNLATRTATIQLAPGETVTCTFTATKRATIVVKKVTNPSTDANTVFTFTGHPGGTVLNGGTISESVAPGAYTATETPVAGWDLTSVVCDDSDSTGNVTAGTATFAAAPGEKVTCTFTNTKRGTIVVKPVTVPSPDPGNTQFAFTGQPAGSAANGQTVTTTVAPGTYTSIETVPAGWDLTGLACNDSDSTGAVATATATFKVAAGETVTCTFTNTKRGQIVVKQVTNPSPDPSNTQFAFTGHPAGTVANGGTATETVPAGTYTSTQTVPAGWDLTALTCNDTDSTGSVSTKTATFNVAAGETVTCTFTDTKRPTIIVKENTAPSQDGSNTSFTFAGHPAGSAVNGGTVSETVVPGTYTTTQTVPAGWDLTGISCNDSDSTGTVSTKVATFVAAPGETITCTFTDTKRGTVIVKQMTQPSPDTTAFTFTGHPAGSIASGATISEVVVPGTYTSTQTVPSTYGLSTVVCNDTDSTGSAVTKTATFRVAAGETVTCTFTDTKIPSACSLGYPSGSAPALSSVVFTANQVIKAQAYLAATNQLAVWFNGPYALTNGIRQIVVKTKTGTTTTNYPTTAMSANPGHITSTGQYGSMILGNGLKSPNENPQAGTDIGTWTSAYGYLDSNRPWWPGVFVTDITTNAAARTGDWQQGGTGRTPTDIFGTWKAAVKTVDQTVTPHAVSVVTDADPAQNNWTLGTGSDTPAGGFGSLQNLGYGAELRWNLASLGLLPGHAYRLEVLLHKRVDYQAETCMNVFIPGV